MEQFEHIEDLLGQLPFLKTYSHLLLCFAHPPGASVQEVESWWKSAALQLSTAIPWVAGQVVHTPPEPGSSGKAKIAPCEKWTPPNTIVTVQDCSDRTPSFDEIIAARGSIPQLDGYLLSPAPHKAFPESYPEATTPDDAAPVLAIQLNFVRGGVLVDCAAQHNFIDMSGIEQCLRLLAVAMRGDPFPQPALEQALRDRRTVVPLLQPGESDSYDHSRILRDPSQPFPVPLDPGSPFSWRYYRFTRDAQNRLKTLAQQSLPSDADPAAYISTNDALSAFCWQRITSARLARLDTPDAIAKFTRAVDARPAMHVPAEYPGNLVTTALTRFTFRELVGAPLGEIAAALRRDLLKVNNEAYIRSFATFLASLPDRSRVSFAGNFNPDTDVGSSSWAHVGLSAEGFGRMGKPALIRRPDFVPIRSCLYFMPRTEEGDVDALVCLNGPDFEALDRDGAWTGCTEYIG